MSTNLNQLHALLQVDEDGDWFASKLNQYLVEENKRELLKQKLSEIEDTDLSVNRDITLTQSEADVLRIVQDANKPLAAFDITKESGPGIVDSLKYRQHASATLNRLVEKGLLGKFRGRGRSTYFALPRDAVKQILVYLGQLPGEGDLERISCMTGLSQETLRTTLNELAS